MRVIRKLIKPSPTFQICFQFFITMRNNYQKTISILFLFVFCNYSTIAQIGIEENGYTGIVVAISNSIPESEGRLLIGTIKEIFTNAAQILHNATYEKFYFKEVTILIPQSWNNENEEFSSASSESFKSASIRIDEPNPHYGNRPYTLQTEGCGRRGDYIHLTADYLKNLTTNPTELIGDPGKNLVHEWAHYRYGIFDEYGTPGHSTYPMFYYDQNGELTANFCADEKLIGRFIDVTDDGSCNYDESTDLPDENCVFQPYNDSTAKTSMASYYYFPKVEHFCNASNHDRHVPNKHNNLCDGRSTWDVIRENEDFNLWSDSFTPLNLTPSFKIVQQPSPTFVLVIDTSGSMNRGKSYTKLQVLVDVIKRWIMTDLRLGSALGLITFNATAKLQIPITNINSQVDKNTFVNKMSMSASGLTCIGCGLTEAIKELNSFLKGPGGTIILVSDGEDNEKPFIEDMVEVVKKSKIKVNAIAFTGEANNKVKLLAEETGGKVYFVEDEFKIMAMSSAFYEAVASEDTDDKPRVKVLEASYSNKQQAELDGYFIIDNSIGTNTSVTVAYTIAESIKSLNISSIDGKWHSVLTMHPIPIANSSVNYDNNTTTQNSTDGQNTTLQSTSSFAPNELPLSIIDGNQKAVLVGPQYGNVTMLYDSSLKLLQIVCDYLTPGRYNYTITTTNSDNQTVIVNVVSSPSTRNPRPITTRSWITEIKQNDNTSRFIVFAEVKQGVNPVINANVHARINRPDGTSKEIELRDNGNGDPDIQKDDGIYSRYFTQLSGKGWYSLEANVTATGKTSVLESGFAASGSLPIYNKYLKTTTKTKTSPTGEFERYSNGGTFSIFDDNQLNTVYPPGKVYDLTLMGINFHDSSITIQWTAPGDDLDEGTVEKYDIRFSHNFDELHANFSGTQIKKQLKPQLAGFTEKLDISLHEINSSETFFLALKAVDKTKELSPISNIIMVVQQRNKANITDKSNTRKFTTLELVGIVSGSLLLALETFALVYLLYKRQNS